MKKILLLIISIIMIFTLTGCTKLALHPDDVTTIISNLGHKVEDISDKYTDYDNIVKVLKIKDIEDRWEIEYYLLKDLHSAERMYQENFELFNLFESQATFYSEVNQGNYSTYKLQTSGSYMYLSRVDNTLLYIDVNILHKNIMEEIITALAY